MVSSRGFRHPHAIRRHRVRCRRIPTPQPGSRNMKACLSAFILVASACSAFAGQVPDAAEKPDIAISHRDRFYTSDQFSNTVSVIDPMDNKLLGVLKLGDPTPANLSPLYRSQLLVHGRGFTPGHRARAAVAGASKSITLLLPEL